MIIFVALGLLILIVIIIFASPTLSPIPYFPSNHRDLPLITKALDLKTDQVIFDLGAGDGVIIFEAARQSWAQNLNTKFVAVEMNPILAMILHIRRLLHPNRKRIYIVWGDMFKADYSKFTSPKNFVTIYIYVSPRFIPKIIAHMKLQFKHFYVVSYFYPIVEAMKPFDAGVHNIYRKTF